MPNSLADISVFEQLQNQANRSMGFLSPMSVFYIDNSIQDVEKLKTQHNELNIELQKLTNMRSSLLSNSNQLEKNIVAVDVKIEKIGNKISQLKSSIVQLESKREESKIVRSKSVSDLDSCSRSIGENKNSIQDKEEALKKVISQFDNAVKTERKSIETKLKANPNDATAKADLTSLEKLAGKAQTPKVTYFTQK